ncbi:MAG: MFS transporter [Chloroflexi bacterium]|nr:MFS transporter [Chloroflexota bacterium]
MVFASSIVGMWGFGYSLFGFSALFKPISTELNFSRTAASVPTAISRFEGGFEAWFTGFLCDKFGAKFPTMFGISIMGISLIAMYFVNSLWSFYLVWGVLLGTGSNLALTLSVRTAIANWFVKKRGFAQGVQMSLQGLSGVVVLPIVAWLIATQGWRITCVIGGVVMLVVGLPLVWFFVKSGRPEQYGLLPDGARLEEGAGKSQILEHGVKYAAQLGEFEFTVKQAMKTPTFWLLSVAEASHMLAAGAFVLHAIPFLTDLGIDPLLAAGILSLMQFSGLPNRLLGGWIADRVSKEHLRFLMGGSYMLQSLGTAVFLFTRTIPMIYVWFVLYGIGSGLAIGVTSPMRGRYFGRKYYGSIAGLALVLTSPVSIVAPIYFGWTYDTTGSYISAYTLAAVLLAVSAIIAALIRPPKPHAEVAATRI